MKSLRYIVGAVVIGVGVFVILIYGIVGVIYLFILLAMAALLLGVLKKT